MRQGRPGPFAALVLSAALAAQDGNPPGLEVCFGADVPKASAVAFCRDLGEALLEIEWLRGLQQDHASLGFRCGLVLEHAPLPADRKLLDGISFGVDPLGSLRQRAVGAAERGSTALFLGAVPVGVGSPGHGFAAAVADLCHGRYDDRVELAAHRDWMQVREEYADLPGAQAVDVLRREVERRPGDGFRHGLLFLVQWQQAEDRDAARRTADSAVAVLAGDPRALAVFCDLALRATGGDPGFARSVLPSLTTAVERSRADLGVELVRLRALVHVGEDREIGRAAYGLQRRAVASGAAALRFAEILANAKEPAAYLSLCTRALEAAARAGADERSLLAVRHLVALRCAGDAKAARELVVDATEREPGRVSVNNEAWRWLVGIDETGRFDAFALAMVERMLEQRPALEFFECDTAAMAMARNGRHREAVELQRLAIDRGGASPIYQARLEAYERAARPAQPR